MKDSIRVFKLSSGESVVGSVLNNNELYDFSSAIQISYPLEMVTTGSNLNLSPWIHPIMTEEEYIDINPSNVVMSTKASTGLIKYSLYCVARLDFNEEDHYSMSEPTDEDLDEIAALEEEEAIEEALDELTDPNNPNHTIH
jgi:hypothetical protein